MLLSLLYDPSLRSPPRAVDDPEEDEQEFADSMWDDDVYLIDTDRIAPGHFADFLLSINYGLHMSMSIEVFQRFSDALNENMVFNGYHSMNTPRDCRITRFCHLHITPARIEDNRKVSLADSCSSARA